MSTPSRCTNTIIKKLYQNPAQFNFFQAVRILSLQPIKFKSSVGLIFPMAAIESITSKFEMVVSFIGLIGSRGVLPYHYTEILIKQLHNKDDSLRDFLDIFHHRIISMYYQAWKKYHFWVEPDVFNDILFSLNGSRFLPAVCYAGLLRQPRSAINLEQILGDYFNLQVKIVQFQPQQIYLDKKKRSCISIHYNSLGFDAVLGDRIFDVQNKFRICIESLNYARFQQLLPTRNMLQSLCGLTKFYVGVSLNFDIKLKLQAGEIPDCLLCKNHLLLGWNTWLGSSHFEQLILYPDY